MRIILSNVRSFVGDHNVPIRPLTLLVGENSAGKSTFMAMADAVLNGRHLLRRPVFNVPPYDLGSFDDLASYLGGRGGRKSTFSVGADDDRGGQLLATYRSDDGQPVIKRVSYRSAVGDFDVDFLPTILRISGSIPNISDESEDDDETDEEPDVIVFGPKEEISFEVPLRERESAIRFQGDWQFDLLRQGYSLKPDVRASHQKLINFIEHINFPIRNNPNLLRARSIAPVRTRPSRVYDAPVDQPEPEGDHIPFVLARTLARKDAKAEKLLSALEQFGKDSGLFGSVTARRLRRKSLFPFQITVNNSGPEKNLLDVGYGVSQALPILVESLLPGAPFLLVQQPEVHLHPKAQAALGSFFAQLVASDARKFVIETHSDFIIDRVRMAIGEGKLKPSQVALVFFERKKIRTRTFELHFDDQGNISGAPPTYREFFLREQLKVISP